MYLRRSFVITLRSRATRLKSQRHQTHTHKHSKKCIYIRHSKPSFIHHHYLPSCSRDNRNKRLFVTRNKYPPPQKKMNHSHTHAFTHTHTHTEEIKDQLECNDVIIRPQIFTNVRHREIPLGYCMTSAQKRKIKNNGKNNSRD